MSESRESWESWLHFVEKNGGCSRTRFDMGNIFASNREDMSGFSPLTAQEDHYTDSEDEGSNEKQRIVTK